jgi:hypothetical protein
MARPDLRHDNSATLESSVTNSPDAPVKGRRSKSTADSDTTTAAAPKRSRAAKNAEPAEVAPKPRASA